MSSSTHEQYKPTSNMKNTQDRRRVENPRPTVSPHPTRSQHAPKKGGLAERAHGGKRAAIIRMGEYATGGGSGLVAVTGLAKRAWSGRPVEEECGPVEEERDLLDGGRSTKRCFS